jgi:hypothetical protein
VTVVQDRIGRLVPGIATLRGYRRGWLSGDIAAGLTLTGILVPAGMAYAEASGLPAITGLYATIVPLLVYALLGPSRLLMLGPDSSLVPLILVALAPFAAMAPAAVIPAAALLALLVGAIIALGGVARLGFLADLLSSPARTGFLAGIALIILVSQLPRLLGFSIDGDGPIERIPRIVAGIAEGRVDPASLVVGVAVLVTIVLLRARRPSLPGVLIAVAGATLVSALLDLAARTGIIVVGPLPQGLPSFAPPALTLDDVRALLPAAAGIALVTAIDTVLLSRTFGARHREPTDANRELVALGLANIATGLFSGYPVSSSASRTAVAEAAGIRTQLAGVIGAAAIVLLLVVAPGLLAALPIPALASVVIAAAFGIADPADFVRLWHDRRSELAVAVATFLGVVVIGVIQGIAIAVVLSLLSFLRRAWWPHDAILGRATGVKGYHDLHFYPTARQVPGLVLYRFDAPLLFFNAGAFHDRVLDHVRRGEPSARWVVIAAEPITDVDTTAAEALASLIDELGSLGVTLAFAELKDPVKLRLRRYGTMARIGEERCFPTIGTAVDAYLRATGEEWVDWEESHGAAGRAIAGEAATVEGDR